MADHKYRWWCLLTVLSVITVYASVLLTSTTNMDMNVFNMVTTVSELHEMENESSTELEYHSSEQPHAVNTRSKEEDKTTSRMNVLFIIADDMRPEIGPYDGRYAPAPVHPKMHTPNLNQLASQSAVFQRAYCQFPLCGPSRASFLTSRRPDTLHQYSFDSFRFTANKDIVSMPQYFMQHGYTSIGIGKIFDPPNDSKHHIKEEMYSFSKPWFQGSNYHYWTHEVLDSSWVAVSPKKERMRPLPDNQVLDHALAQLRELGNKTDGPPFFLAVGFYKPHCPYIFPQKYLEHYPEDVVQMPENPQMPTGFPKEGWTDYHNLRRFKDLKWFPADYNTTLPKNLTLALRRAYYAAITYIDDLIGQVLTELERQKLTDNTIVTFMGDHGYHLGENALWTKQTTLELSARAPLIVHIPGVTTNHSDQEEFVEFVDIFPTLVEAAGLPTLPLCPEKDPASVGVCTEGTSFMPVLQNKVTAWKDRVFTMQRRFGLGVMGRSICTMKYRYTEWQHISNSNRVRAAELYDHDMDHQENHNIAYDPGMTAIRTELSSQLRAYWRDAIPQSLI